MLRADASVILHISAVLPGSIDASHGPVKPLRDGAHDDVVNFRPAPDHLRIIHADDVIPAERQSRVVRDVAAPLDSDVMTPVDLKNQSVADEEIGDALELIARMERDQRYWLCWLKVASTTFWVLVNAVRELRRR